MNKFLLLFLLSLFTLCSCKEVIQTAVTLQDEEPGVLIATEGAYFPFEKDGTSIYLPESFKPYSVSKFKEVADDNYPMDTLVNKTFTTMMFNLRDKVDGNFYLFYDVDINSFCIVNTINYIDFNKKDAQYMLGIIRRNVESSAGADFFFEKKAANYKATEDVKIFKVIYEFSNFNKDRKAYRHIYMLTTKNKQTYQLIFNTPFEADLDPFIRRMKI